MDGHFVYPTLKWNAKYLFFTLFHKLKPENQPKDQRPDIDVWSECMEDMFLTWNGQYKDKNVKDNKIVKFIQMLGF